MCTLKRILTTALVISSFAGVGLAVNAPARADSVTYARVSPASGTTIQAVELQLPDGAFCPEDANRVIVRLTGAGLDTPLNVTGNTNISALDNKSYPGTAILPLLWTFTDAGGFVRPTPVVLDGDYRLTMSCLAGLSQNSLGDTIADITIDSAKGTFVVTSPNPPLVQPRVNSGVGDSAPGETAEPVSENTEQVNEPRLADVGASPSVATEGEPSDQPVNDEVADAQIEPPANGDASPGNDQMSAVDLLSGSSSDISMAAVGSTQSSSFPMKPLLIGGGLFLLMVVVLLGLKSRRSSAS